MNRRARLVALGVVLTVLAAACSSGGTGRTAAGGGGKTTALPQVKPSPHEEVPSGLDDPTGRGLPHPLVAPAEHHSGGSGPDGIPAVDAPTFQHAGDVGWLRVREPVLSVELASQARAYSVQTVSWG